MVNCDFPTRAHWKNGTGSGVKDSLKVESDNLKFGSDSLSCFSASSRKQCGPSRPLAITFLGSADQVVDQEIRVSTEKGSEVRVRLAWVPRRWAAVPVGLFTWGRSAELISSLSLCGGVVTCALVRRRLCRWSCCEPHGTESALVVGHKPASDKTHLPLVVSLRPRRPFTCLSHMWCLCDTSVRVFFVWVAVDSQTRMLAEGT